MEGSEANSLPFGTFDKGIEEPTSEGFRSNSVILGCSLVRLGYSRISRKGSFDSGVGFLALQKDD